MALRAGAGLGVDFPPVPQRPLAPSALRDAITILVQGAVMIGLSACGPGGGTDAAITDGRADVSRDGARDATPDAPDDGAVDAGRLCAEPCAECMTCVAGRCLPLPDGRGCGGGVCRRGACCTGCWDGEACRGGADVASCGATGARCRDCDCAGDACTDGNCVPQRRAATVAAGQGSTCATDTTGRLLCWGGGSRGAVGHGAFDAVVATPTNIGRAVSVAVGGSHACAILAGGEVSCWGANDRGQLGLGDIGTDRSAPAPVPALEGVVALSLGEAFSCAVDETGKLRCWGAGESGQLGVGATNDLPTPTAVAGEVTFSSIGAGDRHACALADDQRLYCWGANESAQLGLGVRGITRGRATPTLVDETTLFTTVSAGSFHSCAQGVSRTLFCWGDNARGQLGAGDRIDRRRPTPVSGILAMADAGSVHGCSVQSLGALTCWGHGGDGRLGRGNTADSLEARPIGTRRGYLAVSAGGRHSCVVDDVGAIYCWGDGSTGQLGAPSTARALTPVRACLPPVP